MNLLQSYWHELFTNDGWYCILLWVVTTLAVVNIAITIKTIYWTIKGRKQKRTMAIQEWNQKRPEYSKATYNREETRAVLKEMIEKLAKQK